MATLTLKKKYTSARAWIKKEYPDLFNRPMAIGLLEELLKVKPKYITRKQISSTLYNKSLNTKYQHILINNDKRYHLDGSVMGIVPKKHKIRAQKILDERGEEL